MEVVHVRSPDAGTPGLDSGNKKLASLLDKQPRWLKPRDKEDMGRRLDELALSPTRSTSRGSSSRASRPHAASDPTPMLDQKNLQSLNDISPTNLSVPPFHQFPPTVQTSSRAPRASPTTPVQVVPEAEQQEDESTFKQFLRQSTFMSASTDCTTGSLRRVLGNFSDPYVKTVKKLIKRYTAPINREGEELSPISDHDENEIPWFNDPDMPPTLPTAPYHLPGDFLNLDVHVRGQPQCFQRTEDHMKRACWCFAQADIREDVWVTAHGLSPTAEQVLRYGPRHEHASEIDCFGNTILHFLSARGETDWLFQAIESEWSIGLINANNSAGQTLLHDLHPDWFRNDGALARLLLALRAKKFKFDTLDHYGRAFSHILIANDSSHQLITWYFENCIAGVEQKRDAFNVKPEMVLFEPSMGINRADTQAMDIDFPMCDPDQAAHEKAVAEEAQIVELVCLAEASPWVEDEEGRNGLHCLAAAVLSSSSVVRKYNLDDQGMPTTRRPRKDKLPKDLDSCKQKLELRQGRLEALLEVGVNPNHYDIRGNTPLMAFAAQLPEDDDYTVGPLILHRLIQAGANIDARNRAGETALHIAVRCGRKRAVEQLIKDGANVYARDAAGRSVLEVADIKMKGLSGSKKHDTVAYAHLEACRAYLSGLKGLAVQEPTVVQEWSVGR